MVRKVVRTVDGLAATTLPYPETPVTSNVWSTGAIDPSSGREDHLNSPIELSCSDASAVGSDTTLAWAAIPRQDRADSVPTRKIPLEDHDKIMKVDRPREDSLPPSLRAGLTDLTPRSSFESQASADLKEKPARNVTTTHSSSESYALPANSNNPYLRLKTKDHALPPDSNLDGDNSASVWATTSENHTQETQILARPPLNVFSPEPFAEPWFDFVSTPTEKDIVAASHSSNQNFASILNPYEELGGNPFEGLDAFEANHPISKEEDKSINAQLFKNIGSQETIGSPGNVDHFAPPPSDEAKKHQPPLLVQPENALPELPPRPSRAEGDVSSAQQLRAEHDVANSHDDAGAELKTNDILQLRDGQRNETYQIKLINWNDSITPNHLRKSPIMVQNANGPCPLLALVNALTLSTPGNLDTPLVETLKTREQISLSLLLDAVLDELMSGRRGNAAQGLHDVGDLYSFLITLHTGMNVNPLFVPADTQSTSLLDEPIAEFPNGLITSRQAGGFENTREMRLYSTFAVPLIHGWVPPNDHVALGALKRSARTYEEAQTLLFREEEIEDKLQRQGLTSEEQVLLEDVASVKYFLATSATQLTSYGLQCISESLRPGSIAILFRNDHFSTLYKHPQSGQLLTLVTDMGYAGHDEVIWESLVDMNGEGCEYFAGDFRPVGNVIGNERPSSNHDDKSGWSTVPGPNRGRRTHSKRHVSESSAPSNGFALLSLDDAASSPRSSKAEQEDHDLALALQLQEEEEDRERRETAARRRQDQLSQAYVDSRTPYPRRASSRGRRGASHTLNPSVSREQDGRPIVPPRVEGQSRRKRENSTDDAPPPTYEQAAKGPAYHPPEGHPTHVNSPSPTRPGAQPPPQTGAQCQHSGRVPGAFPGPRSRNVHPASPVTSPAMGHGSQGNGHRRSRFDSGGGSSGGGGSRRGEGSGRGNSGQDDEKNCVVM